jgi:hypothetical protein
MAKITAIIAVAATILSEQGSQEGEIRRDEK